MQQFTVPQFIDVEPKIIGPITARQFLIFLGAALFIFLFYKLINFGTFILTSVLVFIIAVVFAFVKSNNYFNLFSASTLCIIHPDFAAPVIFTVNGLYHFLSGRWLNLNPAGHFFHIDTAQYFFF